MTDLLQTLVIVFLSVRLIMLEDRITRLRNEMSELRNERVNLARFSAYSMSAPWREWE